MPRIMVVEDEPDLRDLLRHDLETEGFRVEAVDDGAPALRLHQQQAADLWVLDLMLPAMDGFKTLQALRDAGDQVPVLLLTARSESVDRIQGFRLGADDYLTKPFSILELVARIRAVLRRVKPQAHAAPRALRSGAIRVVPLTMDVRRSGKAVELGDREYRLLEVLMTHPGRTHTRQELLALAWEPGSRPGPRTVDVHIASLRRKLGDSERNPLILTVEGEGYRWVPGVIAE